MLSSFDYTDYASKLDQLIVGFALFITFFDNNKNINWRFYSLIEFFFFVFFLFPSRQYILILQLKVVLVFSYLFSATLVLFLP